MRRPWWWIVPPVDSDQRGHDDALVTVQDGWSQIVSEPVLDEPDAIALPESGWGALIAGVAGPRWARRAPWTAPPPVITTMVTATTTVPSEAPRSAEEQRGIDDDIADYLLAADVPPPPPRVTWALRCPATLPSERFWEELYTRMDERCPNARLPIEVRVCLEEALPELLGPGDRP